MTRVSLLLSCCLGTLVPYFCNSFVVPFSPTVDRSTHLAMAVSTKASIPAVTDPTKIRNIAMVGHSHAGKTALTEWMMYDQQVLTKPPSIGSHHSNNDFSHYTRIPVAQEYLLHVTDTPWGEHPMDADSSCQGVDGAVLVISAADGVQMGTLQAIQYCQRQGGIPLMIAVSKMDRSQNRNSMLEDMSTSLGMKPVPLQIPLFEKDSTEFTGVLPLFFLKANMVLEKNQDPRVQEAWTVLEEAVAMTSDDLLVEYLEQGQLESAQVLDGLRRAVLQNKILPLVYTCAELNAGVQELMDAAVAVLPSPIDIREEAIRLACENNAPQCRLQPGIESGFAARVLHTTVDSFGSLSVLRVITNSQSCEDETFDPLPSEVTVLRTGEKVKMPSISTSFALYGKDRQNLADGAQIVPGDVVGVPKLPESVQTNDILTVPAAVKDEQEEIELETKFNILTPLSRVPEDIPLMTQATITLKDGNKGKKGKTAGGAGDDKLLISLRALSREDLALRIDHDISGKLLVRCMSMDHLHAVADRLMERYGLDVELGRPQVQYRETLVKSVHNIEGRHKKQSGGSGQFGVCYISMEPIDEGQGIEFESRIKGGVISKPFISSVEKGVREQLLVGGPLGFPVTDVRVILTDGKMHSVDSKDIAFQSAGRLAVKAALEKGKTQLLQPMEKVTFLVEERLQGEVSAIVARGNGFLLGCDVADDGLHMKVEAIIPTSSIGDVSDVLRAASGGEAQFISEFSHYQAVSKDQIGGVLGFDNLDSSGGSQGLRP